MNWTTRVPLTIKMAQAILNIEGHQWTESEQDIKWSKKKVIMEKSSKDG